MDLNGFVNGCSAFMGRGRGGYGVSDSSVRNDNDGVNDTSATYDSRAQHFSWRFDA